MPYADRQAYNEQRRTRYWMDLEFRDAERERARRNRNYEKRDLKWIGGRPYITLPLAAEAVGLSGDQIKHLERLGYVPQARRRKRDYARLYTLSQTLWMAHWVRQCRGDKARVTKTPSDLVFLPLFLRDVWNEPYLPEDGEAYTKDERLQAELALLSRATRATMGERCGYERDEWSRGLDTQRTRRAAQRAIDAFYNTSLMYLERDATPKGQKKGKFPDAFRN